MNLIFHKTKIYLLLVIFGSCSVIGCSSLNSLIGLPRALYDDSGLGNNIIGQILKDAKVWTMSYTYRDGGDSSNPRDKIYPHLKQFIDANKATGRDVVTALNQSNFGVVCQPKYCEYKGYYYFTTTINNKAVDFQYMKERGDYHIHFDPTDLANSYRIEVNQQIIEKR